MPNPDDALLWTAKPPAARQPKRGERLWCLSHKGKQVHAELRGHGQYGWECQFWLDGEFSYGRRWNSRTGALEEAEQKRQELAAAGWTQGD